MCKLKYRFAYFLLLFFTIGCSANEGETEIDLSTDGGWVIPDVKETSDVNELAKPKASVRIVTFNVRHYFDDICDSGACNSSDDFEHLFSTSEFKFYGKRIADALKKLNADVIVLQELEKETCMNVIADELGFSHRVFGEVSYNASLDVGIIGKHQIVSSKKYRDQTTLKLSGGSSKKFTREFLEAEFVINKQHVFVFGAHFKSKSNDNPAWRAAEGLAAKNIISKRFAKNPNTLVVLGGDLNDTLGSNTLDNLVEDGDLIAAHSDKTWTYQFRGDRSQIDHLIYAKMPNIKLKSVSAIRDNSGSLSVSDHAALLAEFEIR